MKIKLGDLTLRQCKDICDKSFCPTCQLRDVCEIDPCYAAPELLFRKGLNRLYKEIYLPYEEVKEDG